MKTEEKQKLAHETLLKEIHNIDEIAESHSRIIIIISSALIVYAVSQQPGTSNIIAVLGILIAIEWILKIVRHRKVFRTCHDKLSKLEKEIGIDAIRPLKKPYKNFFSLDGYTLLIWFAIVLITFWVLVIVKSAENIL
jgi:heme exporter protein D